MRSRTLHFEDGFRVAFGNARGQAAGMVIAPGGSEGGAENRHRGADQWLFVIAGKGEALVEGRSVALAEGTLLLIERGERHEVRNTGSTPMKTLNVYTPPAYTDNGDPLPAGED